MPCHFPCPCFAILFLHWNGWSIFSRVQSSQAWSLRQCLSHPPCSHCYRLHLLLIIVPTTLCCNYLSSCLSPLLDCSLLSGSNLFCLSLYYELFLYRRQLVARFSFFSPPILILYHCQNILKQNSDYIFPRLKNLQWLPLSTVVFPIVKHLFHVHG